MLTGLRDCVRQASQQTTDHTTQMPLLAYWCNCNFCLTNALGANSQRL